VTLVFVVESKDFGGLLISYNNCEKANSPISTGKKLKPPSSSVKQYVNLAVAVKGSDQTRESIIPIIPANSPLNNQPSLKLAIALIPKSISANISHGPNSSAHSARSGAIKINTIPEMTVPTNEDQSPIASARPGSPFLTIGYPSKVVAIADGVP